MTNLASQVFPLWVKITSWKADIVFLEAFLEGPFLTYSRVVSIWTCNSKPERSLPVSLATECLYSSSELSLRSVLMTVELIVQDNIAKMKNEASFYIGFIN